jgi:hypothetical protein
MGVLQIQTDLTPVCRRCQGLQNQSLYHAASAVTWGLGVCGNIRRTTPNSRTPDSRLLQQARVQKTYCNPDPHGK